MGWIVRIRTPFAIVIQAIATTFQLVWCMLPFGRLSLGREGGGWCFVPSSKQPGAKLGYLVNITEFIDSTNQLFFFHFDWFDFGEFLIVAISLQLRFMRCIVIDMRHSQNFLLNERFPFICHSFHFVCNKNPFLLDLVPFKYTSGCIIRMIHGIYCVLTPWEFCFSIKHVWWIQKNVVIQDREC